MKTPFSAPLLKLGLFSAFLCATAFFISVATGCKKHTTEQQNPDDTIEVKTWDVIGQENYAPLPHIKRESFLPKDAKPWAGTVSHHLLAGDIIDQWFKELAQTRNVKTFFIICPSHWGLSVHEWSLGNIIWKTKYGPVYSASQKVHDIASSLNVQIENQVYPVEHGINTLIPFIAKHFPNAKIVPIALKHPEPPLNQRDAQTLYKTLAPYFSSREREENFLLISTDFAHHGNYEGTVFKDTRSREFFKAPGQNTWIFCGCDNRPGIYALGHIMNSQTKATITYHTNSYEISGLDENDITSYFFSFFY